MAITVLDVRIALNSISEDELSSLTIQQKLVDAEAKADDNAIPAGGKRDRFVRDWAAYISFLVSKTYESVRIGDVAVSKDLEEFLKRLRERANESLQVATSAAGTVIIATPMFDDRPKDPYDTGDLGGVP